MQNLNPMTVTPTDLQNPQLDAETLRHIAQARPELRQAILQHPNCHAELAAFIQDLPQAAASAPPNAQQQVPPQYQQTPQHQHGQQQSWQQQEPGAMPGPTGDMPLSHQDERTWGIVMHVGNIFLGFISPLVIWLIFKDRSPLLDRQGKTALNWGISVAIYYTVSLILTIILIGWLFYTALWIVNVVFSIMAAVKASNREYWKYPISIPFFKDNQ